MRYRQNAKHSLDGNDLQMQSVAVTVCVIVTAATTALCALVEKKRRKSTHGHVSLRGLQNTVFERHVIELVSNKLINKQHEVMARIELTRYMCS